MQQNRKDDTWLSLSSSGSFLLMFIDTVARNVKKEYFVNDSCRTIVSFHLYLFKQFFFVNKFWFINYNMLKILISSSEWFNNYLKQINATYCNQFFFPLIWLWPFISFLSPVFCFRWYLLTFQNLHLKYWQSYMLDLGKRRKMLKTSC